MNKDLIRIPTKGMPHEEWLAHRRKALGGSDAAAIVGLNEYSSPFSVWADKLGKLPEKEDSEAMRQGRDLEAYVAQRFCEATGKRVRRENSILYSPAYPFAHANVDRMVVGEDAGLECKTTSVMNLKRFKNGDYPATYYVQCMHYMAVTGASRWYLAVLILNQGFHWFCIERDEEEIATLMQAEEEFWGLVQREELPPVDGSKATSNAIDTLCPGGNGGVVELFGREATVAEYLRLKEEETLLHARIEALKQVIMLDMKDAEKAFCGSYSVTWKQQSRTSLDAKALQEAHPEIDLDQFKKTTTFRRFGVKEEQ